MFIDNKYKRIYFQLIDRALSEERIRSIDIYYENHHILPRCLGGLNNTENLVLLTAREHFIAHHLLIKVNNSKKLKFAFWAMCNQTSSPDNIRDYNVSSRTFETARNNFISSRPRQDGKNNPMYGKKHTLESKNKISRAHTGRKPSTETKKKMSISAKKRGVLEDTLERLLASRKELNKDGKYANTDKNVYKFKNLKSDVEFIGSRIDFCRHHNFQPKQIYGLINGISKTFNREWKLI